MKYFQLLVITQLFIGFGLKAQEANKILTLEQVLVLAKEQSPDAMLAKHRYLSSFWEFKTYQAGLLPQLNLQSELVNWNKSIITYTNSDGSVQYTQTNNVTTEIGMSLRQNIGFPGVIFLFKRGQMQSRILPATPCRACFELFL
ncbi:MAG: hypothetical protein WCX31_03770 [Salinivirgaceae bacterium]